MYAGFSPFPELKTARLRLRSLSESDEEEILFLRSDPRLNKFIYRQRMKHPEEARVFILRILKDILDERCLYWAISLIGNPTLIGVICLWNFSEDHRTAEMGYELMPAFQKQGIMQEAVTSVLHYGFEQISLEKMEAFTHKKNKNSIRLLKKNGFRLMSGRTDENNTSNIIFSLSRSGSE
jgi:[ribosomal protein S5]-alanine N-acetyltransferase